MTHPTNPNAVKIKRDNERGYAWVATFDPDIHELFDAPAKAAPAKVEPKPAPKGKAKKAAD